MPNKLLNDNELELKLATSPAARVTKEYMESRIANITYTFMKDVSLPTDLGTICTIYLDNGYTVRGEAGCVNPENFDAEIGKRIAYDNAIDKLWPLFGFLLAESQFQKPTIIDKGGPNKADLSEPYSSIDGKWRVDEQLYPESRGYRPHEFPNKLEAQNFINNAKD